MSAFMRLLSAARLLPGFVVGLLILCLVLVGVKSIVVLVIRCFCVRILFSFVEHGDMRGQRGRGGHPEANRLGVAGGTATASACGPIRASAALSLRSARVVPRLVLTVRKVVFFQDFSSFINGLVII